MELQISIVVSYASLPFPIAFHFVAEFYYQLAREAERQRMYKEDIRQMTFKSSSVGPVSAL
jgi:hypothetical protein